MKKELWIFRMVDGSLRLEYVKIKKYHGVSKEDMKRIGNYKIACNVYTYSNNNLEKLADICGL